MSGENRQIVFASRPQGGVTEANFDLQVGEIPSPGPGEMLIRNLYMSVDPYMRGMMNDAKS